MARLGELVYEIGPRLYVNLTNRCTNNCTFCIRRTGPTVAGADLWLDGEPPAEDYIRAIPHPERYEEVVFCGYGEPLLRLDALIAVARHVKEHSETPVRVDTNGQANLYHGRNVLPDLVGVVDAFSISLNAQDNETYQKLSRPTFGERAYPAVLAFAREAVRLFPKVILTVVDVPGVDVEACRRIAESMGAAFRVREYLDSGDRYLDERGGHRRGGGRRGGGDRVRRARVPDVVIRRLVVYLRILDELDLGDGDTYISSQELGERAGASPAQVRKDLASFGEFGKQGVGYNARYLREELRSILNLRHRVGVAVIGVGELGKALARYISRRAGRGERYPFHVAALFDTDPQKVGRTVDLGLEILPAERLTEEMRKRRVDIAIITVPASAAQGVADVCVEAGVKAILNFAPVKLFVPDDVRVHYSDVSLELQQLAYYLS